MNKKVIFIVGGVFLVLVVAVVLVLNTMKTSTQTASSTNSQTATTQSNSSQTNSSALPIPNAANSAAGLLAPTAFNDTKNGFQIYPPKNWEILSDATLSIPAAFVGPNIDEDTSGSFQPSLSVYIAAYAQTGSLADLVADYKKQVVATYPDYTIVNDQDNSDKTAHFVGGTYSTAEGLEMRNLALLKVANGKAYTVNAIALASKWSTYSDLALKSMLTFKLGN